MNPDQIASKINSISIQSGSPVVVNSDTVLTGPSSPLDSLMLIQLCAWLEGEAIDSGALFKWTAEDLMSTSSFFRDCKSISAEYLRQLS